VVVGPRPAPTFGVVTPQGELIGTDASGALTVYVLDTLEPVRRISDTVGFAQDLRIDAAGTTMVVKGGDRSVEVYDLASGARLGDIFTIPVSQDSATQIRADGAEMFVGGSSGDGVGAWSLDPAVWREQLCALAGRNLTVAEWERELAWSGAYRATCPQFPSAVDPAAAFDGVWRSSLIAVDDFGLAADVAADLVAASGPEALTQLVIRGDTFQVRTRGADLLLASGTVAATDTALTFTSTTGAFTLDAEVVGSQLRLTVRGSADGVWTALAAAPLQRG